MPFFRKGRVEGEIDGVAVTALLSPSLGGLGKTISAVGSWDETPVNLIGSIGSMLDEAWVRGAIGDEAVNLVLAKSESDVTIKGTFAGPPPLLLILVTCLLKFTGSLNPTS